LFSNSITQFNNFYKAIFAILTLVYLVGNRYSFGKWSGFAFSLAIFTVILFYALVFLQKIPSNWQLYHVFGITLAITIVGLINQRLLR